MKLFTELFQCPPRVLKDWARFQPGLEGLYWFFYRVLTMSNGSLLCLFYCSCQLKPFTEFFFLALLTVREGHDRVSVWFGGTLLDFTGFSKCLTRVCLFFQLYSES